jgi:UDP-N-acetylglucosamine 2-epimerase (non-hydrolysing)
MRVGATERNYGLVTLHRPSNVDDPEHLAEIVEALSVIADELPLYFPVHPRTRMRLHNHQIPLHHRIHLNEPLGYHDFLRMMSSACVVLTDSGGIQEETTALGVSCLSATTPSAQ